MSTTLRGRRVRFDNIANNSALTTPEKVISGQSVTVVEIYGGGFMTSTSTAEVAHSNVAAGSSVTDQQAPTDTMENIITAAHNNGLENITKAGG